MKTENGSSLTLNLHLDKATGGPKRPLVPGFPVTLKSRCFIGTVKHMARLRNTLRFELRLVRGLGFGYIMLKSVSSTDRCCEPLQIGFLQDLSRGPHLDFEALQWLEFGVHKRDKKRPPTERVHFTSGQLQLPTSNHDPRN